MDRAADDLKIHPDGENSLMDAVGASILPVGTQMAPAPAPLQALALAGLIDD